MRMKALFSRILRARYWASALSAFKRDDTGSAIRLALEIEKIGPLEPHHLAFIGQVYVWRGETDKARGFFKRSSHMASQGLTDNSKYVELFSKTYLTLMDTEDPIDDMLAAAAQLRCRPALKRWLPLTNKVP